MALEDTIVFLQERVRVFNANISVEEGSKFYQTVLAPLARRLETDPFTTNVRAFLADILSRNFPDLAAGQLDALTEALIVPMEVMLSPIISEITRVHRGGSFLRPDELTIEEADALGANLFQTRERGEFAKGSVRIYFNHPQPKQVDVTSVFLSDTGLGFVPNETQSITASEMLLNKEGSLYYMNVNVVATEPGDQYNLEPHQIVNVQGVSGAVKVTNPAAFAFGLPEQTAEEFIDSIPSKLGEQGMSQPTGIIRQVSNAFPLLTRIAVVGYGDPEMTRDILRGGSLGPVLSSGFAGRTIYDSSGKPTTRWFQATGVNPFFTQFPQPLVLTVSSASLPPPHTVDLKVRKVLNDTTLETVDSALPLGITNAVWSLRRYELRVTKAPSLPEGEVFTVPPDEVHVGGAVDVYCRASTFTPSTTTIDCIDDAEAPLQGKSAQGVGNTVTLHDFKLGTHYQPGSKMQELVEKIWPERWFLQILDGPGQGVWEILNVQESQGNPLTITLYNTFSVAFSGARWRILDDFDIDLREPKLVRWQGGDLETSQGLPTVTTTEQLDFDALGVEVGDVVQILQGGDAGEYRIVEIYGGGNRLLRLDQPMTKTSFALGFRIYRPNTAPPLDFPIARLTNVELLDATGQPLQVKIPYGRCLGGVSKGLTNPGVGVKLEVGNAMLGIISLPFPGGANLNGKVLWIHIEGEGNYVVTFAGVDPIPLSIIADQINTAVGRPIASPVGDRLGIFPLGKKEVQVIGPPTPPLGSTGLSILFGFALRISTKSIRSPDFTPTTFTSLKPALSLDYDVVQIRGGGQPGGYSIDKVTITPINALLGSVVDPNGLKCRMEGGFLPEANVRLDIGARSVGTVRAYFLEPVTVEMLSVTEFVHKLPNGSELTFFGDPHYLTTLLPAAPKGEKPVDGNCVGGDNVLNSAIDFRAKRIRPGDLVVIDYIPIVAGPLPNPVPNLAGTTLHMSFDGSPHAQHLTFVTDDPSIPATHVTRNGVLKQINRKLGSNAARLAPGNVLEIHVQYLLSILPTGTANAFLGLSNTNTTTNRSRNAGTYTVVLPGNLGCTLDRTLVFAEARMQYTVKRPGSQRIGVTRMKMDETNLYFMDVEVVSEGTGDIYNLEAGAQLSVKKYFADGYDLSTRNEEFSLSMYEDLHLHLPLRVNNMGTNDDPEEATSLQGLQVQVSGESSAEIRQVQTFLETDLRRDTCASPLARCLIPHHIFFTLDYTGGPSEQEALNLLRRKIHAIFPDQGGLSVDDVVSWIKEAGAEEVFLPLRISAVVMGVDRKMQLISSQNRIQTSGQAAYYPTGVRVRRRTV